MAAVPRTMAAASTPPAMSRIVAATLDLYFGAWLCRDPGLLQSFRPPAPWLEMSFQPGVDLLAIGDPGRGAEPEAVLGGHVDTGLRNREHRHRPSGE